MRSFEYFILLFALLQFHDFVRGLQCLQGQRLLQGETEISNAISASECSDPNAICHRYDIIASLQDQTGKNFPSYFFNVFV